MRKFIYKFFAHVGVGFISEYAAGIAECQLKYLTPLEENSKFSSPLQPDLVKIYVCGPTVQDVAHLGHARTYIAFDAIIRFLEYRNYKVFYVRNITGISPCARKTDEVFLKYISSRKTFLSEIRRLAST